MLTHCQCSTWRVTDDRYDEYTIYNGDGWELLVRTFDISSEMSQWDNLMGDGERLVICDFDIYAEHYFIRNNTIITEIKAYFDDQMGRDIVDDEISRYNIICVV